MTNFTTSSQFPANLPVFKGDNYDRWCAQMKVIFRFQDVLEIVADGVGELAANADETARTQHKELKKKDAKGLFIIHQCVDSNSLLCLKIILKFRFFLMQWAEIQKNETTNRLSAVIRQHH
jgi:hypothetical protein